MANANTNFGNGAGTGTVGADGFLGPLTGNVTGNVIGNVTGAVTATGVVLDTALVAAAGSNSQANSTALTKPLNIVVTVSATTRGVKLPVATTGKQVEVINGVTTNMKVYPATNGKIGSAATNANISLASLGAKIFTAKNTTQWYVTSAS